MKKSVENQTYREYVNNTNSFDVNSSNNLYYNSLNSNINNYLGYDISSIRDSCGNLNCSKDDENNKNNLGKLNINQRMTANDIFNNLQMQKRIKNNYEKINITDRENKSNIKKRKIIIKKILIKFVE